MDRTAAEEDLLMGALLRIPYTVVAEATNQGLSDAGFGDVRVSHLAVLQPLWLHRGGVRLTDLAALAQMTKPSMAYLVNHLEAHGYVERVADPLDGRAQRVRATERGLEVTRLVREIARRTEAHWEQLIGEEQIVQLKRLLGALVDAVRRAEPEAPERPA
jgi:DNA-binding MarR family transcriptional regulator